MQHKTIYFLVGSIYSILGFFVYIPHTVEADTYIQSKTLSHSEVWDDLSSTYHVQGTLTIPKGISLTIAKGVHISVEVGHIDVRGTLTMEGTSDSRISLHQDTSSSGIVVSNGDLHLKNIDIDGGKSVVYATASSTINLELFTIKAVTGSESALYVEKGSVVHMTDGTVTDVHTTEGVEVSGGGSIYVDHVTLHDVGTNNVFKIGSSTFNTSSTTSPPYLSIVWSTLEYSHNGIEVFNHARLDLAHCALQYMSDAGVKAHNHADVAFFNAVNYFNQYGLIATDSIVNVQNSPIAFNTKNGYNFVNVRFTNVNNWYNDAEVNTSTGTYSETSTIGTVVATSTPTACCSNVLFIPGIEASRLYKKQLSGENQLWEPNSNADVTKLYLNVDGTPKDKTIYTRDIIKTTNLTYGLYEKDIYKGFADHLDGLRADGTIKAWAAFAYDWRRPPSDVAEKDEQSEAQFKNLESALMSLASSSKTHKVTIVGHSYGGIVAQYFLKYLAKKGESSLVDNLILVAVPEQGTVESIGALLHGDDQQIFDGLFLDSTTARTLGLNMPSSYYLLPNTTLLTYMHDEPVIRYEDNGWFDTYGDFVNIKNSVTAGSLKSFLLSSDKKRPYARSLDNTILPARLNDALYRRAATARDAFEKDDFYKSLSVNTYNIVGTGIDTVSGYEYYKKECDQYSLALLITTNDPYCGFGHRPAFTIKGDGTVLIGDLSKRWGTKLVFNVGVYNTTSGSNRAHADIMLATPVMDTIDSILHGGSPTSTLVALYHDATQSQSGGAVADGTQGDPSTGTLTPTKKKIVYAASDTVGIKAVDSTGKTSGHTSTTKTKGTGATNSGTDNTTTTTTPSKTAVRQKVVSIPNSSYRHVGDTNYLVVPEDVSTIKLIPTTTTTGVDEFGDPRLSYFTFSAKVIPSNASEVSTTLYIFKLVPVTATSKIDMQIVYGSTTHAVIHLDLYGDGHVETISPVASSTSIATSSVGDIHALIQRIKAEISTSTIRTRFQTRYLTRIDAIDGYLTKNKISYAEYLVKRNDDSLHVIRRDLDRDVPRIYRGGMNIREVDILRGMFDRLVVAFAGLR